MTNPNPTGPFNSGIYLLDKKAGPSSNQSIQDFKFAWARAHDFSPRDLKIGHAGTLDPFATGLLVVLVGQATKLSDFFLGKSKTYSGVLRLGEKTSTGDPEGAVVATAALPKSSTLSRMNEVAASFCGREYLQTPPAFSAKKVDGKKSYELARAGVAVALKPIAKKIFSFTILARLSETDFSFRAEVSAGTYIRTLAEDFAEGLGTVAHLRELRREASGNLPLPSYAQEGGSNFAGEVDLWPWIPLDEISFEYPRIEFAPEDFRKWSLGIKDFDWNFLTRSFAQVPAGLDLFYAGRRVGILTAERAVRFLERG